MADYTHIPLKEVAAGRWDVGYVGSVWHCWRQSPRTSLRTFMQFAIIFKHHAAVAKIPMRGIIVIVATGRHRHDDFDVVCIAMWMLPL